MSQSNAVLKMEKQKQETVKKEDSGMLVYFAGNLVAIPAYLICQALEDYGLYFKSQALNYLGWFVIYILLFFIVLMIFAPDPDIEKQENKA
jgi:uncharacterized BrkB/YihY/UPF0761 family membrane protein